MTMSDPHSDPRAASDPVGWMQDQMTQVKTQVGRLTQTSDQIQAAILDVNEKIRDSEGKVREMTARTLGPLPWTSPSTTPAGSGPTPCSACWRASWARAAGYRVM